MHNNNSNYRYNGYSVSPSAHRLPDGWFASNLLLVRGDVHTTGKAHYKFDALDYFDSEARAIRHAATWAREWVDSRG
ncbi:hypothetical protein [Caballeronia terrestris]|jgi:hypothetical protein|uniref:hypothetical protein n=1 Tax=Caballeronia terrestris TaxID=1226301 RepID=UPI000B3E7482|nr:hypothetical protein [Caballeronia terrestris]